MGDTCSTLIGALIYIRSFFLQSSGLVTSNIIPKWDDCFDDVVQGFPRDYYELYPTVSSPQ